jgi:hypothetical protein
MRIDDMFLTWDMKLNPEDIERETGSGGSGEKIGMIRDSYREWMNDEQRQVWEAYYDSMSADFRKANLSGKALLGMEVSEVYGRLFGCDFICGRKCWDSIGLFGSRRFDWKHNCRLHI